ncbi:MAG: hypothetical protein BWY95_02805 [Bacteroidetes bacterium ADurb.BinA104]|nr:MAG: hypothetical protein BWY95_02805 [Bacteroidetes bacterium ADurb.BinA104]
MRGCRTGNRQRSVDGCSIGNRISQRCIAVYRQIVGYLSGIERCQTAGLQRCRADITRVGNIAGIGDAVRGCGAVNIEGCVNLR